MDKFGGKNLQTNCTSSSNQWPNNNDSVLTVATNEVNKHVPEEINDTKVAQTDLTMLLKLFDGDHVYHNFTSPKGLLLLINNYEFDNLQNREGTKFDGAKVKALFQKLGYKVEDNNFDDLKGKEMLNKAKEFASMEEHKNLDSCIVVVLSHGEPDHLIGTDGVKVNIHEFLHFFGPVNAPFLANKPKLFFLQACRGDNVGTVGIVTADSLFSGCKNLFSHSSKKLPLNADIFIAYSTAPNYTAFRDPENGSWFIESIFKIFSEYSNCKNINSLLTMVNKKVYLCPGDKGERQISEFHNRLRKEFFFFPGITSPPETIFSSGIASSLSAASTNSHRQSKTSLKYENYEQTIVNWIQLSAESTGTRLIKSVHGTYMRAYRSEDKVDMINGSHESWKNWYIENHTGKVVFKSIHSKFLRAFPTGHVDVVDKLQAEVYWRPLKNDDGSWSFLSVYDRWLTAGDDGTVYKMEQCDSWGHFWLDWWL